MKMQIHYGLFDPATNMGGGNYWTWFDTELPLELLNRFYYEIAVKHLATEPNKLTADDLWGGIALLDSGWTVLYCIFNGGYDRQDRPGRSVILTAWVKTSKTAQIDLSPILRNKTFREIAAVSKELPVPSPAALTETCEVGTEMGKTLSVPDDNIKKNFGGVDAVRQAMEYFANIPPERFASLKIVMTSAVQKVVLEGKAKISVLETQVKAPPVKKPEPIKPDPVKFDKPTKSTNGIPLPPHEFSLTSFKSTGGILLVGLIFLLVIWMFLHPIFATPSNIKKMFQKMPPETQKKLIHELQQIHDSTKGNSKNRAYDWNRFSK